MPVLSHLLRVPCTSSVVRALILWFCGAASLLGESAVFRPGAVWLDTAGHPINAHGGGVLFHNGSYYWYGENKAGRTWLPDSTKAWEGYRVDVTGIRCYSSPDLRQWKNEGLVLKAVPDDPAHDLHPYKVCERPKVVFNPWTKKFVMWMHIDSEDYQAARAGVAVADKPTGPFTYLGSVRPEGQDSRDQTVFQDEDGKAYRVYSSENNDTTYISLLTDDYLKHSGRFIRLFEKRRMEAPVVFKHGGRYWFIASGCTGWDPNPARAAVADSIWGPWTELGNPCRGPGATNTFGAQSTFVSPVAGKSNAWVFMADRWNKTNLVDSRYVWLPLHFEGGQPVLEWAASWDLTTHGVNLPDALAKKGVGFWNGDGGSSQLSGKIDALGCGWYYNWTANPDPNAQATAAQFVPMIWSAKEADPATLRRLRESGCDTLLAFNEPDKKDQANLSVTQALELWPKLIATGLRLGSPAPANPDQWLPEFMREAERRQYRVDFVCLHWYGDITHSNAVEHLRQFLTENWERYRKPIWLTEFSGSTGEWIQPADPPVDAAKNAAFVRRVVPMLESLPFVERYAWFELQWAAAPWEHVALVNPKTGALTTVGAAYREARPVSTRVSNDARAVVAVGEHGADVPPFTIQQQDQTAWLVKPNGERFFSLGVCCVNQGASTNEWSAANPGYAAWQHYTNTNDWAGATLQRLKSWGFTTVSGWSDFQTLKGCREPGFAFAPVLHIGASAGAPWRDMWDPKLVDRIDQVARESIVPLRDDPRVIGYYTDNEIGWWNAILFKMTLEQASTSGQRQRLIQFLRNSYRNDWAALMDDFEPAPILESWEELERHGMLYLRPGGSGIRVERQFLGLLAERYYSLMRDAVRKYDRRALILGDRFPSFYYPEVVRASVPYLDVISCNLNPTWNDGSFPRYQLDTLHALSGKPVIIGEFYMAARENRSGNKNNHGAFPVAATQEERARGFASTTRRLLTLPYVIGADWFQYYDEPTHGRLDGENFNFGLVDIHNRPYEAITAAAASLDPSTTKVRSVAARLDVSQGVPPAPENPFEPFEPRQALQHWDRERGFVKPESDFPLADLYLCWNQGAIYLGLCAQDVVEDVFYRGKTVLASERSEWVVSIPGLPNPIHARTGAGMEPIVDAPSVRILNISGINGRVRNIAALELPAKLFGKEQFRRGDSVELNSVFITHGRAYRVSWSGRFVLRGS